MLNAEYGMLSKHNKPFAFISLSSASAMAANFCVSVVLEYNILMLNNKGGNNNHAGVNPTIAKPNNKPQPTPAAAAISDLHVEEAPSKQTSAGGSATGSHVETLETAPVQRNGESHGHSALERLVRATT